MQKKALPPHEGRFRTRFRRGHPNFRERVRWEIRNSKSEIRNPPSLLRGATTINRFRILVGGARKSPLTLELM